MSSTSTDQLQPGDIVRNDMMRLHIDRPIRTTNHPLTDGRPTYATSARIINAAELRAEADRGNGHARFILNLADHDGDDLRWVIQGNHLATWFVEGNEPPG